MNQRAVIRRAWERRKKTLAPTPQAEKAEAFFRLVDEQTDMCWEEFAEVLRSDYSDATGEIVATLLETDDPLIIYNCIRFSDQSRPQEMAAMKRVARECDCERHQVSLVALAHTKAKEVTTVLQARENLPQAVRAALRPTPPPPARKKTADEKKEG